ncbi:MAG TPA: D-alanyl-D-alanine carboxypeptidase/D-alanyl-D-alanine-endopeptidase [Candidatus Latescibacteria bacterium]|nr:D-alanyl-D-alanine carboxypeptidase/D-alanyl-D-alanine-endopeptidase [Candidatus Latescibacterota bacterium]
MRKRAHLWLAGWMSLGVFATCIVDAFATETPWRCIAASLDTIAQRRALASAQVGIAVWSFDRREWVYEKNADRLFVPASNAKVLIGAAALHTLGPAKTFSTTLTADRVPIPGDSVLTGNIYLYGGGNPDLVTGDLVGFAETLRASGIRRIRGSVVVDASHFDSENYALGWSWEDRPYPYCPPISAFLLNGNVVQVTVRPGSAPGRPVHVTLLPRDAGVPVSVAARTGGEHNTSSRIRVERSNSGIVVKGTMGGRAEPITVWRTVPDPVRYAGSVFMGALQDAGITVERGMSIGTSPRNLPVLARVYSDPVDVILRRYLKRSDNLLGETLVKQMGVAASGRGTWEDGLSAVRRALREIAGLDSNAYRLADGSGLSRLNEISPRMLVQVITSASSSFSLAPEFLSALSTAGVDGTLSRRMTEDETRAYLRGKTGTLSGVSSLSGVVESRSGERFACAIMMNGTSPSAQTMRQAQDDVVRVLRNCIEQ